MGVSMSIVVSSGMCSIVIVMNVNMVIVVVVCGV